MGRRKGPWTAEERERRMNALGLTLFLKNLRSKMPLLELDRRPKESYAVTIPFPERHAIGGTDNEIEQERRR